MYFDSSNFYLLHLSSYLSTFFCFIFFIFSVYFSDIRANYYIYIAIDIFLKDFISFENLFCLIYIIIIFFAIACVATFLPLSYFISSLHILSLCFLHTFVLYHWTIIPIDLASFPLHPAMFRFRAA